VIEKAQRAPSGHAGFADGFDDCAQTPPAITAKWAHLSWGFGKGDGLENRRLRQCRISNCEVLISFRLSACGEVAERLKAAVC
jgi:hypothetical protein